MFGSEEILAFIRRSIGVRSDEANEAGSLHARVKYNALEPFTPYSFGGNGSLGDVVINTNATINGVNQYNNLTVNAGVTLTCETGTIILVKRTLTVNGLITASGKGGAGATSTSVPGASGAGIAGSGGAGGAYYYNSSNYAPASAGGDTDFLGGAIQIGVGLPGRGTFYCGWGKEKFAYAKGAGGGKGGGANAGNGGSGGGSLIVEAMNVIITSTGAIRADGINGGNGSTIDQAGGGGGGGGGILIVNCSRLQNSGIISAAAGTGGPGGGGTGWHGYDGGNGGTGIALVISR